MPTLAATDNVIDVHEGGLSDEPINSPLPDTENAVARPSSYDIQTVHPWTIPASEVYSGLQHHDQRQKQQSQGMLDVEELYLPWVGHSV